MTRQDIDDLLKSIGKPGEKQDEKIQAVKDLNLQNTQGIDIVETIDTYGGF